MMASCPKCGGGAIVGPRYCSGATACSAYPVPSNPLGIYWPGQPHHAEHLSDICATCGFAQPRPCRDEKRPS